MAGRGAGSFQHSGWRTAGAGHVAGDYKEPMSEYQPGAQRACPAGGAERGCPPRAEPSLRQGPALPRERQDLGCAPGKRLETWCEISD